MIAFKTLGRPAALLVAGGLAAALMAGCAEDKALSYHADAGEPAQCAPATPGAKLELGCANRANLAAMVANPADLQQGQPLSPASGARQAAAVDAYKKGQTRSLNASPTSTGATITFGSTTTPGNQ